MIPELNELRGTRDNYKNHFDCLISITIGLFNHIDKFEMDTAKQDAYILDINRTKPGIY